MIVACVSAVEFILVRDKHTVQYAEAAQRMTFNTPKLSKLQHVVAEDLDQAKIRLIGVVKDYLRGCPGVTLNPVDFRFETCYEQADENGQFYAHGGYSGCASCTRITV